MAIRIDGTNTTANPGITGADADTGLQFGTNELKLVTGGTEAVKIDSNQKLTASQGILFGTDTADVNTLDDYEEGTWTPAYAGATTSGTYTYDTAAGAYTKIGNRVIIDFNLSNITTVSAGSGSVRIVGLPFLAQSVLSVFPHGACRLNGHDVHSATITVTVTPVTNDNRLTLIVSRDDSSALAVSVTNKTGNSADILASCTYFVD